MTVGEPSFTELPELRNPIVIAAFEGWNDAADAASDALRFLQRSLRSELVFELEPQEYSDFQAARPHVEMLNGVVKTIRWLATTLSIARLSTSERDVILVLGVEPNLRWPQFCDEILSYATIHGASTIVTLGALLGDAPHTRPFPVTGTASDPATIIRLGLQRSRYEGPTGIVGVLADAARRSGFEAISLWAPVPHYTATAPSPKATLTLLERLRALFDLPLDLGNLAVNAASWQTHVDSVVETDGDLTAYVHQLEDRFDSQIASDGDDITHGDIFVGEEPLAEDLFGDDSPFDDDYTSLDYEDDDGVDNNDDDDDDDDIFDEDDLPDGEALAKDFERYLRDQLDE